MTGFGRYAFQHWKPSQNARSGGYNRLCKVGFLRITVIEAPSRIDQRGLTADVPHNSKQCQLAAPSRPCTRGRDAAITARLADIRRDRENYSRNVVLNMFSMNHLF